MKIETRHPSAPEDFKHYTTEQMRKAYVIERVFAPDEALLTYSHFDRIIAGGVMPVNSSVSLTGGKELASDYFLERREMGIINIGGPGIVRADDEVFTLHERDGLYLGKGVRSIIFESEDCASPAKFYINSATAHHTYPNRKVTKDQANPRTVGSTEQCNRRTIYQYLHPAVMPTCQLCMGLTALEPGSNWNTMPAHTHERRMEVYLYLDLPEDALVFHLMGEPKETRHLVMRNEQALISPSWSIHSGVGTQNYAFIWGMAGENQDFDDMDVLPSDALY